MSDKSWEKIFKDHGINSHDFDKSPFVLEVSQIKESCHGFRKTVEKEPRLLCKHDAREDRPSIFQRKGVFILPVKNGIYNIVKGEGYVDIPDIGSKTQLYKPRLDFELDTASVGNSEMQHLDYAYATSVIRTFIGDDDLVLTIRGRKYTPKFDFNVGGQQIKVEKVQTEVDAGYEGRDKVVLVEAKNRNSTNVIIRQLYYPYRQWQERTRKKVIPLFFQKEPDDNVYSIWQFKFTPKNNYNGIKLVKAARYCVA